MQRHLLMQRERATVIFRLIVGLFCTRKKANPLQMPQAVVKRYWRRFCLQKWRCFQTNYPRIVASMFFQGSSFSFIIFQPRSCGIRPGSKPVSFALEFCRFPFRSRSTAWPWSIKPRTIVAFCQCAVRISAFLYFSNFHQLSILCQRVMQIVLSSVARRQHLTFSWSKTEPKSDVRTS